MRKERQRVPEVAKTGAAEGSRQEIGRGKSTRPRRRVRVKRMGRTR